jgi:hypothetical protein
MLQQAPALVRSIVQPLPALSVSKFWSKYIATNVSSAFKLVALVTVGDAAPPVQ